MRDSYPATPRTPLQNEAFLGYQNPTVRVFGDGSFDKLPSFLQSFRPKTVLLGLGQNSFRASSYFEKLESALEPYRIVYTKPIPQNPKQDFVQEEINRLKTKSFDLVLAIGGGSVLDAAKILATIARQDKTDLNIYCRGHFELPTRKTPLIAIPTTSGTGSEVTPFASLETTDRQKITISHWDFYPTVAIIDPKLSYSMPAYVTACTGFDALSQAIESFWSVRATSFSKTHSLRALDLLLHHLSKVMSHPTDANARAAMALGSCEAGLAIAQTMTTAVHSVSYPMTTHFSIAHGHACALTLSSFTLFNAPVLKEEGRALLKVFGVSTYDRMAQQIDRLMVSVGLKKKLSALGINKEGVEIILRDGFRPDRIKNNPRPVNRDDLQKILLDIY